MSRVRIIYKSGAQIDMECESFTVMRSKVHGDIDQVKWKAAKPRPLHIGVDQIAAIWELDPPKNGAVV